MNPSRRPQHWKAGVGISIGLAVSVIAIAMTTPGRSPTLLPRPVTSMSQPTRSAAQVSPTASSPSAMSYPVNVQGQTYGSLPHNNPSATPPTLVAVQLPSGVSGYVYWQQLQAVVHPKSSPKTPQQALAWDDHLKPVSIPVYTNNGATVIGQFAIGGVPHVTAQSHLFDVRSS